MVLNLDTQLEAALHEAARQRGLTPEALALGALRERFLASHIALEPRDDWERQLLAIGVDCGVSLSNEAASSEGIND
jgi:hypothetical protein